MSEEYRERNDEKDSREYTGEKEYVGDVEGHKLTESDKDASEAPETDESDVEGHAFRPNVSEG